MNVNEKRIHSQTTKYFLWGLIGSVVLGALLGIVFVLRDSWGWFEVRVILTTVTIAVTSLCGLACDVSRTPRGLNLLPKSGMTLAIVTAAFMLTGIWIEIDSEEYWKATACVSTIGVAVVHVCLLSIARLATRFRWIRFIGNQIVFGLALCSVP